MNPSATSAGGARQRSALADLARAQPEAPFLFYRSSRGHFRWWSYSTAATFLDDGGLGDEKLSVKGVVVEREAAEMLGGFLRAAIGEGFDPPGAAEIPGPGPGAPRDVWISWRSLTDPDEVALARWAILTGAAILVEPGPALHPELFAWTRPTVVSGTVEELGLLADQVEALAPRFLRRRWFRQRGLRLRLVLVSGGAAAEDLARVEGAWRGLSKHFAPSVAPLARASLV